MASSPPLVALDLKTPQQPDLLEKYSQLQQLRASQQQQQLAQQEAPVRQQILSQQAQTGQMQQQQEQQNQQDQQAFRMLAQDPSNKGKTIGDLADSLLQKGQISPSGYASAKKADIDQRQSLATLSKDQLAAADGAHKATQQLYDSVMDMPDDQLAANWSQIAQQYDAIPGNNKQPLNPNQPLTKQQLQSFGPMISMQRTYLDEAISRDQKKADLAKTTAEASKSEAEAAAAKEIGGVPGVPPSTNAVRIYAIPEDQRTAAQKLFIKGYEKNNDVTKVLPAQVRIQGLMQMPQAVADPNNPGQTVFVSRKDAIGQQAPNSGDVKSVQATEKFFSPAGKGGQNLAAFNTAQNHLQLLGQASEALGNGNVTMLNDIGQKYSKATGSAAPTNFDAVKNAVKGEVARALTGNVTVSEQAELDKDFNNASSPKQIQGVIQKYTQLMQGKKDVLHQQYTDGMSGKVNFDDASGGSGMVTVQIPGGATGQIPAAAVTKFKADHPNAVVQQ